MQNETSTTSKVLCLGEHVAFDIGTVFGDPHMHKSKDSGRDSAKFESLHIYIYTCCQEPGETSISEKTIYVPYTIN